MRRRVVIKKEGKSKPTFNEYLVEEFQKELSSNPIYVNDKSFTSPYYEPYLSERQTLHWLKTYFTGKYKDFDELILLKKFHLLNSMFGLGGIDVVELALNKLMR